MHALCLLWIVQNVSGEQWRSLPVLRELPWESILLMFEILTAQAAAKRASTFDADEF